MCSGCRSAGLRARSPTKFSVKALAFAFVCVALGLVGCEREERVFRPPAAETNDIGEVPVSALSPGGAAPPIPEELAKQYESNAYALSQGKQWFAWFNCNGCHGNGGGNSGPALMSNRWIYGGSFANVAASIRDGRPNGMPAFGGKVPKEQIYQLAAYVRSMSRNVSQFAAPSRNDAMQARPAENRLPEAPPGSTAPAGRSSQ